jgi:acetoin utilization protein AcuB
MTAFDLIAQDVPELSFDQTGRDAFHMFNDYHVRHLPVVDDKRLVGILSEEDIFNHNLYDQLSTYDFSMVRHHAVRADEHLFDVMRIMGEHRLTAIPVIDEAGEYLGMITQSTLLNKFSTITAFAEQGGIIVLEMDRREYSLSILARMIEEENARILSTMVSSTPDSELLEVTVKINREDLVRIVSAMERHGYTVKGAYLDDPLSEGLKDRYNALMHYLDM